MKRIYIFFLLLSLPLGVVGQDLNLEEVMSEIDFKGDTLAGVFKWVTHEIAYDVQKSERPDSIYRTEEEKIRIALEKRKGICEDYSLLFDRLLKELGYESFIIRGFTRTKKQIEQEYSHAWNAVKVKGKWLMFDPTWSAGFVSDEKFVKQYNELWYKVPPEEFIYTHIPFDPVWQLLQRPVKLTLDNQIQEINGLFSFEDSIRQYAGRSDLERLEKEIARVNSFSVKHKLVKEELDYLIKKRERLFYKRSVDRFNEGVAFHNEFIDSRNNRFRGIKHEINKIKEPLEKAKQYYDDATRLISGKTFKDADLAQEAEELQGEINQLMSDLDKQLKFVDRYERTWKPLRIFLL